MRTGKYPLCNRHPDDPNNQMNYPLVMKMNSHSRGRGMLLIKTPDDLPSDLSSQGFHSSQFHFEEYHKIRREYRAHVVGDKVIMLDRKVRKEGFERHWLKNKEHGYRNLKAKDSMISDDVRLECIKAVKYLGLVFGAVDFGITSDGELFIFEVNSCPGMRTKTKKVYSEAITEYLLNNYRIEICTEPSVTE